MSKRHYPEPPVKYEGHSDLHFATEEEVRSPLSLANHDRGEIVLAPGRVTFTGMRVLVECPNVTEVRLVRKTFPWVMVAVVACAAALAVYLFSPIPFTWRQPLPYCLVAILLVASFLQWREHWVEVSYSENGEPRWAYFRRNPMFGFGAARTQKLLSQMRTQVLPGNEVPPS